MVKVVPSPTHFEEIRNVFHLRGARKGEVYDLHLFSDSVEDLGHLGRPSSANQISVVTHPDPLASKVWGPGWAPGHGPSSVRDGIREVHVLKPQEVPLSLAQDQVWEAELAKPLGGVTRRHNAPPLGLRKVPDVAAIDRPHRDDNTGEAPDDAPTPSGWGVPSSLVIAGEHSLLDAKLR